MLRHKNDFDGHLTKRHQIQSTLKEQQSTLASEFCSFGQQQQQQQPQKKSTYFIFYLLFRKGSLHKSKMKWVRHNNTNSDPSPGPNRSRRCCPMTKSNQHIKLQMKINQRKIEKKKQFPHVHHFYTHYSYLMETGRWGKKKLGKKINKTKAKPTDLQLRHKISFIEHIMQRTDAALMREFLHWQNFWQLWRLLINWNKLGRIINYGEGREFVSENWLHLHLMLFACESSEVFYV